MARSFKFRPFWKKNKSHRIDKESKTILKNKLHEKIEAEEDTDNSFHSIGYATIFFIGMILISSSCVSTKKLTMEQEKVGQYAKNLEDCEDRYNTIYSHNKDISKNTLELENQLANEQNKYNLLEQQMEYFKSTNTNMLGMLSDLAVVSKTGADNIKKSLDAINDQNKYIKDLTLAMRQKDSLNLALVMKLKRSLADINDEDVTVEVKKGVVYISLSDKLMFKSGSAEINQQAEVVLGKIAKVLNDHKNLEILVEGHTDNVPISNSCMIDNWDLSVKRATTVVRYLQLKHNIIPARMTAGGRSEFVSKDTNTTSEGRAINRRTEIIILPQLDQFFELLEPSLSK